MEVYLDWRFKFQQDGLGDEYLASLSTQVSNLRLQQLHLLAGATSANFQEAIYDGVEVDIVLVRHC